MQLDEQQLELRAAAAEFAKSNLGRNLPANDTAQQFDRKGWELSAEYGVLRMLVPEELGGRGMRYREFISVLEGLGLGTSDHGLLFSLGAHLWTTVLPLVAYGTDAQKSRYLEKLINGEWIAASAATEPEAGSDLYALQTIATKTDSGYVLNGRKIFATNAEIADVLVVYATLDPSLGPTGITAFLVERDQPGLEIRPALSKMGLRTSPFNEVALNNCEINLGSRLGREGRGLPVFESVMEWERGAILGPCLGAMQRLLDRCVDHARARRQFGQPIGKFQSVSNRIVDMKVRLETSRLMIYHVADLKDKGLSARSEAAAAKLYVSESFVASAQDAMRVFGTYGYLTDNGLERELRDALGGLFYSGTSDIQRNVIAQMLRV